MKLSKEQIDIAANTNLANYLRHKGIPLVKNGSRHKHGKHDSLVFTKNLYYWNSINDHGTSIDYLTKHMNIKFQEAVKELCEFNGVQIINNENYEQSTEFNYKNIEFDSNVKRSIAYLTKTRNLDYNLIIDLVNKKLISQTKQYSNISFLMRNENRKIVGIEYNTTLSNSRFKGIEKNSMSGYGFNILNCKSNEIQNYYFFESAIDLLSFIQLRKIKPYSMLVSMAGLKEIVIKNSLEKFKSNSTSEVYICCDNDKAGINFCRSIKKKFSNLKFILPNKVKDWNEMLKLTETNQILPKSNIEKKNQILRAGLPETNETNENIINYFTQYENIDSLILKKLTDGNYIYEDKNKRCIFVGFSKTKEIEFASSLPLDLFTNYAIIVNKCNKLSINNNTQNLVVTESPLNSLRIMTIMKLHNRNLNNYSFLMINDKNNILNTLNNYLKDNSNTQNISFAFDNNSSNKDLIDNISTKIDSKFNTIKYYSKSESLKSDLNVLKGDDKNGYGRRYETNDKRTLRKTGKNRSDLSTDGSRTSTSGEIQLRNKEIHEGKSSDRLQTNDIERGILSKSTDKTGRSLGTLQNNTETKRRSGKDKSNRGSIGENSSATENLAGNGFSSNERNNPKTSLISNFKQSEPIEYGGSKQKYQNNISAIKLLKELEKTNSSPSHSQQIILSKYTGWGGIPQVFDKNNAKWEKEYLELKEILSLSEYEKARGSTPNSHYTDPIIIKSIYTALEKMNFKEGKLLEPSLGSGNFFANLPDSMKNSELYGVELDDISGRVAKKLYPLSNIQIKGFEKTKFENNFFDVALGNVPFGSYGVYDPEYKNNNFLIHDYFFSKTIDKVKPGGLIAFITSKGTMDKSNMTVRKHIAQRANLLGAIRLPNDTFKSIANTSVTTDIIFLQKRDRPIICDPDWVHTGISNDNIPINQYFINNPDMLMGKMVFDKSMYGNEKITSLIRNEENIDIEKLLEKAINKISYNNSIKTTEQITLNISSNEIAADPDVKNYTYTLFNDELYYRQNNIMVKSSLKDKTLSKAKKLHLIRQSLREVINIQTYTEYSTSELKKTQETLNKRYDNFVNEFGYINNRNNMNILKDDTDLPLILSIERETDKNKYKKADIFYKATIKPRVEPIINSAYDSLISSLNNYGKVNLEYMSKIYPKSSKDILDDLENTIFLNPKTNEYETKDNYLSGNVKEKLEIAMDSGEDFEKNVEELLKVQPEPLKIYDIGFKLGSNWIPTELYKDFIFDILETPYGLTIPGNKSTIDLHYNKFNSEYKVENKNVDFDNVLANTKFGTKFTNAYKLIEDSLNLKFTTVYERIVDEDGNKKSIVNQRETQISRAKQEVIKNEFINWITRSEKRITKIEKIYNKNFNVFIPRKYDGSNLIIPTMNSEIELRPHQKDAAMRILLGGNTLIAHEVGSGKTMTLATGAILLKQSGIAKKPLFVVPNHLPQQWAAEFLNLFPTSNILVPTKRDFEKKNRQKFIAKIATGDYDAVILTFSQFEKIPMSNEFINNQIKTHINEITDAISEIKRESLLTDFSVKQYESMKKKLEDKLLKMTDDDRKDKLLTFEELGIDYIFCDEAQEYKNCYVHSKMTNVAGISNVSSNKSYDMLMKTKYITEKNNGRGVIFATGTPVTNSISETYVMQRYLQESTLLDMGIRHFDQWASIYGDITSSMELDPTGTKYRIKTRFSKFHNMPELLKIFNQISDFKSFEDLNIKRPDIETGKPQTISVKPSQYVKNKMIELEKRADSIKNSEVDSSEDNMLLITNHGRAIAIDPRILDPYAEVDNDSKLYKCTENVAKIYKEFEKDRSLQLIFLDYGIKLYNHIKEDLILKGIKADEIAFIGDAKNDKEKESLFSKCRRGDVRILIGSTFKMGAGTNVQNRMIALHNLDCPWRPADLQQRNGRIRRQGNMYDKIKIFQYITEATFDSYSYQILEKKQMFISQLMKNDFKTRVYDDLDAATLEYSEIKALCCGDPRIKEKADIDNEIQKLQIERNNHLREQDNLKSLNKKIPENILFNQKKISDITSDLDKLQKGDKFEIILKSRTYTKRIDAGENLNFIIDLNHQKEKFIGYYKGLEIRLYKRPGKNYLLGLKGKFHYNIELGDDPVGNIKRIENIKFKYIKKIELINHQNNSLKKQLETVKDSIGKPFSKENLLSEKLHRQSELAYELEKPEFEEKTPSPQIDNSNKDSQTKPKDKLSLTIK